MQRKKKKKKDQKLSRASARCGATSSGLIYLTGVSEGQKEEEKKNSQNLSIFDDNYKSTDRKSSTNIS